jgi:hypothetical protein
MLQPFQIDSRMICYRIRCNFGILCRYSWLCNPIWWREILKCRRMIMHEHIVCDIFNWWQCLDTFFSWYALFSFTIQLSWFLWHSTGCDYRFTNKLAHLWGCLIIQGEDFHSTDLLVSVIHIPASKVISNLLLSHPNSRFLLLSMEINLDWCWFDPTWGSFECVLNWSYSLKMILSLNAINLPDFITYAFLYFSVWFKRQYSIKSQLRLNYLINEQYAVYT